MNHTHIDQNSIGINTHHQSIDENVVITVPNAEQRVQTIEFCMEDFFRFVSITDLRILIYQFVGDQQINLYLAHGLTFNRFQCGNFDDIDAWNHTKWDILTNLSSMRFETMEMIKKARGKKDKSIALSFKPLIVKQSIYDHRDCIVLVPCESSDVFDELRKVQNANDWKLARRHHARISIYMFVHYIIECYWSEINYGYHKTWVSSDNPDICEG